MTSQQKKKNIILITVDEWRWDHFGFAGHSHVKTPNIDALAQSGFVFNEAHCVSPICVPSRVSMFTGQYVNTNGSVFFRRQDHVNLTRGSDFIEELHRDGYALGIAGKNHAFSDDYFEKYFCYREEYGHWGKEYGHLTEGDRHVIEFRNNEFRPYFLARAEGETRLLEGLIDEAEPFPEEWCMNHRIADDAISYLELKKNEPFFLYYSFPDPHWPTVVCEPYHSMVDSTSIHEVECMDIDWERHPFAHYVQSKVNGFENYTVEERQRMVAIYFGMIHAIDKSVGRLLDRLDELGLTEDTIVVFTADHGNFAGRYGLVGKTKGFCDALVKIPLIVKSSDLPAGRSDALVSNIDIFPTLFELLGMPLPRSSQGESLLGLIRGERDEHRQEVFAELGMPGDPPSPVRNTLDFEEFRDECELKLGARWFLNYTVKGRCAMIKTKKWKYCFYVGDMEELYDLQNDPLEVHNLCEDEKHKTTLLDLKNRLLSWILTQPHLPYADG